jgi:hypothetical protein
MCDVRNEAKATAHERSQDPRTETEAPASGRSFERVGSGAIQRARPYPARQSQSALLGLVFADYLQPNE